MKLNNVTIFCLAPIYLVLEEGWLEVDFQETCSKRVFSCVVAELRV